MNKLITMAFAGIGLILAGLVIILLFIPFKLLQIFINGEETA